MTDKSKFVMYFRMVKRATPIMVINVRDTGRLQIVQGTMKQNQYKKILEVIFLLQLSEWFDVGVKKQFLCTTELLAIKQKQSASC
ncbi:hypothetical protein CEXT_555871 [Caerostris extrusa]|uniref:Uncharacterized protein n=1 Tax=Caerostris extrusa TaxID=172846 RepID=A0AAV4N789_CAEEX|nr:hypothetical protein CEXT_555871 [Caerostris extrusa]